MKEQTAAWPSVNPDTKARLIEAAERLCAAQGLQSVSVREIAADAGVNIAALNYHFGTKDNLLFEIFRLRTSELSDARRELLDKALENSGGSIVRDVLGALFQPSLDWLFADGRLRISIQFIMRARSEGTSEMRAALQKVSHLKRFVNALLLLYPDLDEPTIYLRLHFCLGMMHNNRELELARLHKLSEGKTGILTKEQILEEMIGFAERGLGPRTRFQATPN